MWHQQHGVVRTCSQETEVTPERNVVEFGRDFPKEVNLAVNKKGKVARRIHATHSIKEQYRDGKVLVQATACPETSKSVENVMNCSNNDQRGSINIHVCNAPYYFSIMVGMDK
jgi:hypothetical protein